VNATSHIDVRAQRRRDARARELTAHAAALAALLWTAVGMDVISSGPVGRFSHFRKGNDFVQFYVAGGLVRHGQFEALVDPVAFAQAQAPYMPAAGIAFPPVYGPHVAVLFAPFAFLPYLDAYALWAALSLLCVGWVVNVCRPRSSLGGRWPWATVAITAAYPPLAYLLLSGQISALGVAALGAAVVALDRKSLLAAGAAVGLLGYKASLLVPAVAVCLLAGETFMAAAAIIVATLPLALLLPIAGSSVVQGFLDNTIAYANSPGLLMKHQYLMASLRTFFLPILPPLAAKIAYGITGAAAVGCAAWGWRRTSNPVLRVGLLAIATVLAAPHLYLYDLVLLVPAFVASAGILVRERAPALRWATYFAFFVPLSVPFAAYTGVQLVTIVLGVWLAALATVARRY
jgi:alpha-1,2-mannosyltransferase